MVTMSIMRHQLRRQQGVVSLIVTVVMMIVITLLVLGFAEIARNEQRSSLDDQLSAQAYYAAESGINDARAVISKAIATGGAGSVQSKSVCGSAGSYTLDPIVDSQHNVSYTCVLVNATPTTLTKTISYDSSVLPITSGGGNFSSLQLSWQVPPGYTATASGCYTNVANLHDNPIAPNTGTGDWSCNYPMLRVDLLDANGGMSRAGWDGKTSTMFFVPFNSTSVSNSVGLGAKGTAVAARCTSSNCVATITGLGGTAYYMRVTTLYLSGSNLTVSAGGIPFVGVQATIDSTGKAQDVLRRVLVAVDLTDANAYNIPSAAVISRDSVCKRFSVTSGSFQVYSDIDMSQGAAGNYYCQVRSLGTPAP